MSDDERRGRVQTGIMLGVLFAWAIVVLGFPTWYLLLVALVAFCLAIYFASRLARKGSDGH